jgi:hypothetical protein
MSLAKMKVWPVHRSSGGACAPFVYGDPESLPEVLVIYIPRWKVVAVDSREEPGFIMWSLVPKESVIEFVWTES